MQKKNQKKNKTKKIFKNTDHTHGSTMTDGPRMDVNRLRKGVRGKGMG